MKIMRYKVGNYRASQPGGGDTRTYGKQLKRGLPPSFLGGFWSLLINPGNQSLDDVDEPL
jgi:hypothetical protein